MAKKMKSTKAVRKLTDFAKNEENPFLEQAIEGIEQHIVKKYKNTLVGSNKAIVTMANVDTGELFATSYMRQVQVDEEQFVKIYLDNFKSFFNLSQSAIRVFGYIMECMRPKKDVIYFDREECMKYTGYTSDVTIYKALTELLEAEIIARGKSEYLWFINPMIAFNGDRVSFVNTYVRKKKDNKPLEENGGCL